MIWLSRMGLDLSALLCESNLFSIALMDAIEQKQNT